jgi:hypothetical protein
MLPSAQALFEALNVGVANAAVTQQHNVLVDDRMQSVASLDIRFTAAIHERHEESTEATTGIERIVTATTLQGGVSGPIVLVRPINTVWVSPDGDELLYTGNVDGDYDGDLTEVD